MEPEGIHCAPGVPSTLQRSAEIWEAPGEHRARRELGDAPKAKPKGTAELGQAILYYDKESGCFYERTDPTDFGQSSLLVSSKRSGHDESPGAHPGAAAHWHPA